MDWNSDGHPDIVSGDRNGFFNVFVWRDTGLVAYLQYQKMDLTPLNVGANSAPAVCDWNDDGKKDLITGCENGQVIYYRNLTQDSWPMFQTCETLEAGGLPINVYRNNPLVFDLDRDGVQDLICGANDGYVRFFRNTGTNAEPVLAPEESLRTTSGVPIVPPGTYYGSRCGFGDWDVDGVPDFLLSGYDGNVSLFRGAVETDLEEGARQPAGRSWPTATIVRGMLYLPPAAPGVLASLYDMTGRQVMLLQPGANDVSSLRPGVYRVDRGTEARKVIIAR